MLNGWLSRTSRSDPDMAKNATVFTAVCWDSWRSVAPWGAGGFGGGVALQNHLVGKRVSASKLCIDKGGHHSAFFHH